MVNIINKPHYPFAEKNWQEWFIQFVKPYLNKHLLTPDGLNFNTMLRISG